METFSNLFDIGISRHAGAYDSTEYKIIRIPEARRNYKSGRVENGSPKLKTGDY